MSASRTQEMRHLVTVLADAPAEYPRSLDLPQHDLPYRVGRVLVWRVRPPADRGTDLVVEFPWDDGATTIAAHEPLPWALGLDAFTPTGGRSVAWKCELTTARNAPPFATFDLVGAPGSLELDMESEGMRSRPATPGMLCMEVRGEPPLVAALPEGMSEARLSVTASKELAVEHGLTEFHGADADGPVPLVVTTLEAKPAPKPD